MAYPVQADPTAVFGRRVLAALIDAALILVPVIALFTADFKYFTTETLQAEGVTGEQFCEPHLDEGDLCFDLTETDGIERVYFTGGLSGTTQAASWLLPFILHVLLQGVTGRTIGKFVAGIRVVREDGRPPGVVKALVRWLLWVVDAFPYFLPLVGFIVGLTTVGHRRVGDMAAKTFVVRSSAAGSPIVVSGLTAPPSPVGPAGGWGAPPPGADGATNTPQWDEARGTYLQWDPSQSAWMQWNEGLKTWSRIPGQ